MAPSNYLRAEYILSGVPVAACLETEREVLVSALPETIYPILPYLAESYAPWPAHLLGLTLVLDTASSSSANEEALSGEREDSLFLVPGVPTPFAST